MANKTVKKRVRKRRPAPEPPPVYSLRKLPDGALQLSGHHFAEVREVLLASHDREQVAALAKRVGLDVVELREVEYDRGTEGQRVRGYAD